MKNTLLICIILMFSVSVPCKSSVLELQKRKDIFKAKTPDCTVGNTIKVDSTVNFSISIQGQQNLVTIKTDSLTVQTTKSITNKSKDCNTIKINGEGNSVSVYQDPKGKVEVKQNGNNNTVKIVQSSHQP